MQPGVTVVLATVWLTAYLGVVGTTTLHPSRLALDQYSPLAPRRHGVYRRVVDQLDWKDQHPGENQPFDLSIGPRRFISASIGPFEQPLRDSNSFYSRVENTGADEFSSLAEYKQLRNFVDREFTDEKVDGRNTKTPFFKDSFQLPPFELEDPFVADDTFQDQGPGSVEIYKLDLLREKPLLSPTPANRLPPKNKSKTPKKIGHVSWKPKTAEYKPMSPKISRKQSNSFDDLGTEMPSDNDPFSVGGVPELQVGCEGLEAADQKQKRSIDSPRKDRKLEAADLWSDITPVSLEMIYDSSGEEGYEEMDELVKIIKLANTTKSSKHRGDMDADHEGDFLNDRNGSETVPVRGDLGKTSIASESAVLSAASLLGNREAKEAKTAAKAGEKGYHFNNAKQDAQDKDAGSSGDEVTGNQGRKILWFDDREADQQSDDGKRSKRAVWGFGENEGVASSDELHTESHRRRQYDERLRQEEERRRQESEKRRQEEAQRRGYAENRTNSDIEKIREDYERSLEQRKKEDEERRRQLQQEAQRTSSNRRQPQDEHRRRVQEEESRNRWQDEERRRQQLEAPQRRYESRPQTTLAEQELKRREESRFREEERRRQQQAEEMRRREQSEWDEDIKRRQQQELDRRNLEQRRREWMLKKAQEEEEERMRQQQLKNSPPLNLLYPTRPGRNESEERRIREQKERERERKYTEYVQRNRPIVVNASADRQREEAQRWRLEEKRRRMEEERKLQEYIRRNQPIHVPRANVSEDRNWMEYRRKVAEVRPSDPSRYPSPGNRRRDHGPSASTNIDPRSYVDEARRRDAWRRIEEDRFRERERQEAEQRRQEALRREEEVRRLQSRRYEEQRKRLEAARLADERRRKELMEQEARTSQVGRTRPSQSTRPGYEDRRRFEEQRRRQDTRLIPSNLLLNESRRTVDLERQRQEQQRWKIEAERRRQQETRAKGTRDHDEHARAMNEQRRRQEEARLNALPVSARIIIRPGVSPVTPSVFSRAGFDNYVDVPGFSPNKKGVEVPIYPASPTLRPPIKSPSPCVWAVVQCCPTNTKRLVTCFEASGCPGINWDPNPCRISILQAAREEVARFYAEAEKYEPQ